MTRLKRSYLVMLLVLTVTVLCPAQHKSDDDPAVRSKSFNVGKGGQLIVSVDGGDVRVTPWEKNEATVDVRGAEDEDTDDLRMSLSGNVVHVDNRGGSGFDLRYEVHVPSRFDVDIRTSEGNITIEKGLSGKILGHTSSGDIRIGDGDGSIDVTTSGGNIKTGNFKGDVTLNTSGGDLVLGTIGGVVDLNTSGGDIRIQDVSKTLTAKTSGGDIHVGNVGGEANVITSGGSIIVGKVGGKATLNTAGGDIQIASASGNVSAKTAGGNLELDEITGSITAKTAGGDIFASLIPSGTGKSRLVTASGEIELNIPENAKATITARIRVRGNWRDDRDEYRIQSDFKSATYETSEEDDEIRATYILNGGGESINLETSNAGIRIRKAGTGTHGIHKR